jgi:hypothetical protein
MKKYSNYLQNGKDDLHSTVKLNDSRFKRAIKEMSLNFIKPLAIAASATTFLLSGVSSASALQIFTNRTLWENAISTARPGSTGSVIDTFSNNISSAQSITLDSGIISTNSSDVILPNPPFNNNSVSGGVFNNATQAGSGTASNTITWTLPNTTFAFGADFIGAGTNPDRLALVGNFDGTGDQTFLINSQIGGANGFFGIVGTANFNSVVFTNSQTDVDAFSVDNASVAVPWEMDSLSVIGSTLLFGFGVWAKQKFAKPLQK